MKAEDVHHSRFIVEKIIFETDDFSIAYGIWDESQKLLGFRWNGESDSDPGYPKLFGNPVWFVIPDDLTSAIVMSLVGVKDGVNKKALLELLEDII